MQNKSANKQKYNNNPTCAIGYKKLNDAVWILLTPPNNILSWASKSIELALVFSLFSFMERWVEYPKITQHTVVMIHNKSTQVKVKRLG